MAKRPRAKRTTIYDIAAAAEVSASTVSLVLNGSWERYRIAAGTAERVLATAEQLGYAVNLRARGLRLNRSSLAGMIVPHHRNRFFAGLAESFETLSRERGLCPVVVSTQRDRATEESVVRTLVAQQVELLVIAGVQGPAPLNALCREAGIRCVNLDLPGPGAPSVVTDNRGGAARLTERLMDTVLGRGGDPAHLRFVGGRAGEYATEERVAGFLAAAAARGLRVDERAVHRCGYEPAVARAVFERLAAEGLPSGIFVNSITALEGFIAFLRASGDAFEPAVACFDWDPFAAMLSVPVLMLRQDVEGLMRACFGLLDADEGDVGRMVSVAPRLAGEDDPER